MKNLLTNLKKSREEIKKANFLKRITNNLGNIVVKTDKIICYVDDKNLKTEYQKYVSYQLNLDKVPKKEITEYSEYNKPIYYIFENIIFDKDIIIKSSQATNIIFKNCIFNEGICINESDNVIFENNKYHSLNFFMIRKCENITFLNENCLIDTNGMNKLKKENIKIQIEATKKFEMINSKLDTTNYENGEIDIKAKEILIKDSKITSSEIYSNSFKCNLDNNSNIYGEKIICINNKEDNLTLDNIDTPNLVYNQKVYENVKSKKTK